MEHYSTLKSNWFWYLACVASIRCLPWWAVKQDSCCDCHSFRMSTSNNSIPIEYFWIFWNFFWVNYCYMIHLIWFWNLCLHSSFSDQNYWIGCRKRPIGGRGHSSVQMTICWCLFCQPNCFRGGLCWWTSRACLCPALFSQCCPMTLWYCSTVC